MPIHIEAETAIDQNDPERFYVVERTCLRRTRSTPAATSRWRAADMTRHPLTRGSIGCPLCGGDKDRGLLVCWPCHQALTAEFDGGYGHHAEALLDEHETYLQNAEDRYEAYSS